jgi:hypothetical protein
MKLDEKTQNLLIQGSFIIGSGLLAIYLVKQAFNKIANFGEGQTQESIDKANTAVNTYIAQTLQTQKPTKSDGEWAAIADTIYQDLDHYYFGDAEQKDAVYQLSRVKNDADIAVLIKYYGKRTIHRFGLPQGSPSMLPFAVVKWLPESFVNTINTNYKRKGIKFQF